MYRVYGGGGADDDDDLDDRRRQELEDELYREPDDENSGGLRGGGEEAGDRMPVGSSLDPAGAGRAADRPPNGENTETHGAGRSQPGRARGSSAGLRDVSAANNEGDEFIVISSSEDEELTQSAKKHARDRNDEELKYHLGRKRPRSPAGGRRDRLYYTAASRSSSLTPSDSSDGEGLREIRGDREHSASDVARSLDAASAVGDVNRGLSNAYEKLKVTKVIDLDEVVVPEGTAVNPDAFGELETNEVRDLAACLPLSVVRSGRDILHINEKLDDRRDTVDILCRRRMTLFAQGASRKDIRYISAELRW
ncbi:MAG: hypothetical protein BJ554DRAFT_6666 [Olpidium bornovanus]|uniref:Uncharacterized protein n=1 Tax=Olpidium bornovanus TaxID=278681 RepID=A0A8H7ZY85_9FUNG|nr:MAG: hypothetical protein BJ554DRAFT_6666 [Olpidium bornovanus]